MAFIFVPPFNEGDKQTNPDTGVEYIYTDGAWRALGPNIADEFPELDERYVKKAGDVMTGGLVLKNSRNLTFRKADDSNQFAINPNVNSDYFTNIYTFNSADGNGGVRFRVSQDQGLGSSSYDMLVALSGERQTIGGEEYRGKLSLNRVRTPEDPDQAANKWYVDNKFGIADALYLPLTGGDMTGDINMQNCRLDTFNAAGEQTMEIAPSGFIKTRDMLRVVRSDGGPILEGRISDSASDIKVKIDSDGYYQFRGRGELYDDVYLRANKKYIVQGAAGNNVAQFYARTDNIARLENSVSGKTIEIKGVADPVDNRDAVNLQYLNGLPFATDDDVERAIDTEDVHLRLDGGTLTGTLTSNHTTNQRINFLTNGSSANCDISRNGTWQFSIQDGKTKVATDIDMTNHQIYHLSHLKLDHGTGNTAEKKIHITGETADGTGQDLFWSYKNVDGTLDAVNYKGKMDTDFNLVNKGYVDNKVASSGGGVPVGSIMIWMNSSAPAGWFKLQGSSFDINTYPQLHAYLQNTAGYTSGRLPNWSGHYPGEYGDHMATNLGTKVEARTGQPAGGPPRSSNSIPNGATRTFGATGNTNAYSAGASKVTIDENWDNTTRPKTVVVHYIIKHD